MNHKLGQKLFHTINSHLDRHGLVLREGSIADASIIAAPSSTKNKDGKRDAEMHQVKEGNEWHFGMKMHIGVDESLRLIHSLETTPANEHDLNVTDKLLHETEMRVWADAGYADAQNRENLVSDNREWFVAMRPGKRKRLALADIEEAEHIKASVRAKAEHAFFYIKRLFGYSKIRYRGLAKNNNRLIAAPLGESLFAGFSQVALAPKLAPSHPKH